MSKKILVTGAAGFIGYHLTKHLLEIDPETTVVLADNLSRGKMDEYLTALLENPRTTFLHIDLASQTAYEQLDTDFTQIYHLAATNGTKFFYEKPHEVLRNNILSTIFFLEWVKELPQRPKIVFTSSCEAYASAMEFMELPIPTPVNVPLVISDKYNARWSYGGSKLTGELLLINYARTYHLRAVIAVPHNFYGPREGFEHVIPDYCTRILDKKDPFPIYGSNNTRTFCFITDAVEALQLIMDSPKTDAEVPVSINIGGTDEITMRELADALFEVVGWRPETVEEHTAPPGSVLRRRGAIETIREQCGWEPKTSLADGLRATFAWYDNHRKVHGPVLPSEPKA